MKKDSNHRDSTLNQKLDVDQRPRRSFVFLAVVCGVLAVQVSEPLESQQLPVYPGAHVRILENTRMTWRSGEVVVATRDSIQWLVGGLEPRRAVKFNPALRLQVRSESHLGAIVGSGIGLSLGTVVGAVLLAPTLPERAPDGLVTIAVGGLSAVVGALIGRQVGPARWIDVTLTEGRIAPAALTVHSQPTSSLSTTHRWNRFVASGADFAAFLAAHADSLHPLEGLWTPFGSTVGQQVEGRPVRRMVVVRDGRFEGYSYVGVYVSRRAPTREDGKILMALTEPDERGVLELRHIGPSLRREQRILVELEGDRLTLVEPEGFEPLWNKSVVVVP